MWKENSPPTRHIEAKCVTNESKWITYPNGLVEMVDGTIIRRYREKAHLNKSYEGKKLWSAMIAHILNRHGTYMKNKAKNKIGLY